MLENSDANDDVIVIFSKCRISLTNPRIKIIIFAKKICLTASFCSELMLCWNLRNSGKVRGMRSFFPSLVRTWWSDWLEAIFVGPVRLKNLFDKVQMKIFWQIILVNWLNFTIPPDVSVFVVFLLLASYRAWQQEQ